MLVSGSIVSIMNFLHIATICVTIQLNKEIFPYSRLLNATPAGHCKRLCHRHSSDFILNSKSSLSGLNFFNFMKFVST